MGITFSGFNNIDFGSILNAVMQQERVPLTRMQQQKTNLQAQSSAYGTLATKLAELESKAGALASVGGFSGRTASSNDPTTVGIDASNLAMAGTYEVVITSIARSQVTTTSSVHTDKDQTIVASGGSLVVGDATVTLEGPVTLQGLADAINAADDSPAVATVVQAAGQFTLVLSGKDTGAANAFSVDPALLQNGLVGFSATNAIDASDADLTINRVRVTNATNTITDAIPGATLTLQKENGGSPVVLSVARDSSVTKDKLEAFVTSYNDLVDFFDQQNAASRAGTSSSIARDGMLRGLRGSLTSSMVSRYELGGSIGNLSEIGIEFQRTGKITFDAATFDEKYKSSQADVERLLAGTSTADGAFDAIKTMISQYTTAGGLVPDARTRLDAQVRQLDDRMASMEARLAIQQEALQREYTAADEAMSRLNAQANSISAIGSGYRLF